MVRPEASQADAGDGGVVQRPPPGGMPAMRIGAHMEPRRLRERRRPLRMRPLPQDVHAGDRHGVRLVQDTAVGVDGVPAPPLRVPFREDGRPGQQERGFHRPLLAFQGLRRAQGMAGRHRPRQRRGDRRVQRQGARRRREEGRRRQTSEGDVRQPHRHSHRHRPLEHRRLRSRRRAGQDIREEVRRRLFAPPPPELLGGPRRGASAQRALREAFALRRGVGLGVLEGARGQAEPPPPDKRVPFLPEVLPGVPSLVREDAAPGLAQPLRLHLERPRGPPRQGSPFHGNGDEEARTHALQGRDGEENCRCIRIVDPTPCKFRLKNKIRRDKVYSAYIRMFFL